jgi:hypothetical protein
MYTDANGCTGISPSYNITIFPLPTVAFNGLASSYDVNAAAATLTGSPSGGTFSGPGISGNTFTPSSAGVGGPYTISYSYTESVNGCTNSASQQTTVTTCTAPAQPGIITVTGGSAKVCPGDTRGYTIAAVAGASSYAWTAPTGATVVSGQGTTSVSITYNSSFTASGNVSVKAISACGTSAPRTLLVQRKPHCNGARPVAETFDINSSLSLYPNPAHDNIAVQFYSEQSSSYTIRISDYTGRVVFTNTAVSAEGENVLNINLTGYARGVYFLQLDNGSEKVPRKIVVE